MTAEIGLFSLILATGFSALLSLMPVQAQFAKAEIWRPWIRPLALGLFAFVSLAFAALIFGFLDNDFSIKYIANHSHTDLPLIFKISASWGAHEGSLLLWAWILSAWTALVAFKSNVFDDRFALRLVCFMGMIALGFLLFLILTSSPFERLMDVPTQGRSLNPLLQDVGLAIHPPILYMGYVGMAVLYGENFSKQQALWLRNWALVAWAFLTLGIAIGSWWAYYELGWGGWWFWDPVENASLLPWIIATALIHSLMMTIQRNLFQSWTLFLALLAFALSLLGTFLVRSGVLTSVHAFTTDPSRGIFILVYLLLIVGFSFSVFSAKAHLVTQKGRFKLLSKESMLLGNNLILTTMMATILLGTLYPLLLDALNLGKISVGAPYFNQVMLPLTLILAVLMALAFSLQWRENQGQTLLLKLKHPLWVSALIALLLPIAFFNELRPLALIGVFLSSLIALTALTWLKQNQRAGWQATLSALPATLGHLGFAITLTGIFLTSLYSQQQDIRLVTGESVQIGDYQIRFEQIERIAKDNYLATRGTLALSQNGQVISQLLPEKRTYFSQTMPMTEAAIEAHLTHDLFVALGEPLDDSLGRTAWSFRVQLKPFIRWIWFGALLMSLSALVALISRHPALSSKREAL